MSYSEYMMEKEKMKGMMYPDDAIPKSKTMDYSAFQPVQSAPAEAPIQSKTQEINAGEVATAGATGAAAGGPVGAGIAAGGSLLTQYIANKAASERARRDRAAQIEQQYAQNQNQGYQTFFNALQGAYK